MIETDPRDHVIVSRYPRFTSTTSFLGLGSDGRIRRAATRRIPVRNSKIEGCRRGPQTARDALSAGRNDHNAAVNLRNSLNFAA